MPGPYEKFETAFETFQTELRQELHDELEALKDALGDRPSLASLTIPAEVVAIQRDLQNIQQKMDVMQRELHLIEDLQKLVEKLQEKPNPLAFYETILKVRSFPNISHHFYNNSVSRPYFPDVFNDVVSYFGGPQTTDPKGRRFLEEAAKRFAYLYTPGQPGQPNVPLLHWGVMRTFNGFTSDAQGFQVANCFQFTQHEFAVLRQLLEEIFSEEKPSYPPYIELAPPKAVISNDLANILKSQKKE